MTLVLISPRAHPRRVCVSWFSRVLWCIGTASRFALRPCQAGSASGYAPRTFYPVRDVRVTVLYALAHLVGCVTTVGQGHDGEHEPAYAERHNREDYRNEGVNDKDDDPGYLVPERLQGVEAHLPGTVLVQQPDEQGPERHKANKRQEHAKVGDYGPRSLVLRAHRLRRGSDLVFGNSFSLTAEVGVLWHLLSFRPGLGVACIQAPP